jgi:hypothetical protein
MNPKSIPTPTANDEKQVPVSAETADSFERDNLFIHADDADSETYPRLTNMSAAFIYKAIARPIVPEPIEYVAVPTNHRSVDLTVAISKWNLAWEAGQFRRRFFDPDELPEPLAKLAELGDRNIQFVPKTRSKYFEYATLLHLLPASTLERYGLPLFRAGQWPFLADISRPDQHVSPQFGEQLSRAWAATIWPHLSTGSRLNAFSADDPIRLLSHNLDFWVPAVTKVIQNRLADFPLVNDNIEEGPVPLAEGGYLDGAVAGSPRKGGDVWVGELEAAEVVRDTLEAADRTGNLRAILDAVRSNRVEEDFSNKWSNAREDFERKLYRKRAKIAVKFVELTDTIPVQGASSDFDGALVTNEFLAILDERNRQIVILLNSGFTKATEIAEALGYANHSAVSKRLEKIRAAAERFFDV